MSLFLDTSFLYALEDTSDRNHGRAQALWKRTLKGTSRLVLTSYVFDEIVTLLQAKLGHEKAAEVGDHLLHSLWVDLIHVTPEIFQEAWTFFRKHRDKGYSFTDCVSFIVMHRLQIGSALSFDAHFRQAGFKVPG